MKRTLLALCVCYLAPVGMNADAPKIQKARYLRPAGAKFESECEFTVKPIKNGTHIESVTQRGKLKLTVIATFDDRNVLTAAETILLTEKGKSSATVKAQVGKATIERAGKDAQEFDVPAGLIVTSAPDWTDAWMLCRRFDRKKGGKQEFAGLWIHPTQPAQRLTFAIERQGADTIEHDDKKLELDRYTIWLRGNSSYAVWADAKGQMIKLVPLPHKKGATNWIVLEGFEKSAADFTP